MLHLSFRYVLSIFEWPLKTDFTLFRIIHKLGLGLTNSSGPWTIKLFFMYNSTEHGIFPAHKCQNINNCWHFNIYQLYKYNVCVF